jgi:hypothetical protein
MEHPDESGALNEVVPAAQVEALQAQLRVALRLMVFFVWIVALFIGRIAWQQHRSIKAGEVMTARNQDELIRMRAVVGEFEKYGVAHPQFVPVLERYGIRGGSPR